MLSSDVDMVMQAMNTMS